MDHDELGMLKAIFVKPMMPTQIPGSLMPGTLLYLGAANSDNNT